MYRTRLAAQSVGASRARILRRYVVLNIIGFAADSVTRDCGYPSSIQLTDGSLLTSYYMFSSRGPFRQPALRDQLVGPHGAAVKYQEEDLL
jgi:hypothetical protein